MIKMTGHRVLVKADPVEKVSKGGIVLATDEKLERTGVQRGVIVDVGPECWKAYRVLDEQGNEKNGQPWANVGDYVLFGRHAGRYVEDPVDENNLYMVMNDEDILGIFYPGKNDVIDNPTRRQVIRKED